MSEVGDRVLGASGIGPDPFDAETDENMPAYRAVMAGLFDYWNCSQDWNLPDFDELHDYLDSYPDEVGSTGSPGGFGCPSGSRNGGTSTPGATRTGGLGIAAETLAAAPADVIGFDEWWQSCQIEHPAAPTSPVQSADNAVGGAPSSPVVWDSPSPMSAPAAGPTAPQARSSRRPARSRRAAGTRRP